MGVCPSGDASTLRYSDAMRRGTLGIGEVRSGSFWVLRTHYNDENHVEDDVDGDNDSDDDKDANEESEAAVVEKRGGNEAAEKDVNDRLEMTDRNEARGLGDEKEKRKGAPGEVVTRAGRLVRKPKRLDL